MRAARRMPLHGGCQRSSGATELGRSTKRCNAVAGMSQGCGSPLILLAESPERLYRRRQQIAIGQDAMTRPPPDLSSVDKPALFSDFDGTLVEIAATPDAVHLASDTRDVLALLFDRLGGAVAIITGREIAVVDRFLAPLVLPVAGVHGAERRCYSGSFSRTVAAPGMVKAAEVAAEAVAGDHGGVLVERKATSIGLHFRARPDAEAACVAAMEDVAARFPGTHLQHGKMVVEVRPDAVSKGSAIAAFLEEPPFRGRTPVFAGDDVTDEDAFGVVNARGGISIRIGPGDTAAQCRVASTAEFVAWLRAQAEALRAA